jgi:PAS domain-containing protein
MTEVLEETNDRIRDERDRLRSIFESLMDGVFITDRDFRIEFMNQDLLYQFVLRILRPFFNQLSAVP